MTIFLTPSEKRALRRMLTAVSVNRRGFWMSVLLGVIGMGSSIALAATSAWLIARASQHPPVLYLSVAATAVRMFGVLRALMRYIQRLTSHRVALDGMDNLRNHVYATLSTARVDRIAGLQRGDLMARTGADIDAVGDLVVKSLLPATVTLIVSVGTAVGIAFISPSAAVLLGICLVISGVISPLLTMRAARIAESQSRDARVLLSDGVVTFLEGAAELGLNGKLDRVRAQVNEAEDALINSTARAARVSALAVAIDRLAMGGAVIAAMVIGMPATYSGQLAAVLLAVIVLTPLASFEGTGEMASAAVQLVRSAQGAERIAALLGDEAPSVTHDLPQEKQPRLVAENLAIGWPDGSVIAQGINLDISVGDSVAIVGPSGVGKTTLLLTLAGMLPPKSGTVKLNGVEVWDADRDAVTSMLTMTAEDAHIFSTTVYENLRVANPALTTQDALHALETVGLSSWLSGLPSGLETLLGSGATTVSGGERRRLLMARALCAPSALLLADEASEHLDPHTADLLMRTLFSQSTNAAFPRGVVIVTHRLSALDAAERIIMLSKPTPSEPATVVAYGSHHELILTCDTYRWAVEQEQ